MSQSQTKKQEKSSSKSDYDVNAGSLTSNNNNQILKMLGESDQQNNSSRNIDGSVNWRSNPAQTESPPHEMEGTQADNSGINRSVEKSLNK